MNRNVLIVLLIAAGVFAGVWYAAGREEVSDPIAAGATAPPAVPTNQSTPALTVTSGARAPVATASVADVTRWTAEVNHANAATRAAAIRALANVPRAEALPVLRDVLRGGEPQVDRPLALQSLRELALGQGDKDGRVREVIREAIYHNDDQNPTLLADAQEALDVVEESELR
jgi:hypothetical protein